MEIYKALNAIMNDCKTMQKNGLNEFEKYKYMKVDELFEMLHPLFSKHGVILGHDIMHSEAFTRQGVKFLNNYIEIMIKISFIATDGSKHEVTTKSMALDNSDKGFNKAIMAAYKYVLIPMLLINTGENIDTEVNAETDIKQTYQRRQNTQPIGMDPYPPKNFQAKLISMGIEESKIMPVYLALNTEAKQKGITLKGYAVELGEQAFDERIIEINKGVE